MSETQWSTVDRYFTDLLVPADQALDSALAASAEAGLPQINVAPNQGKLLHILARIAGAKKILEIGTLGGYSTIWLARALPEDGKLITLEFDPKHAAVARGNIDRAGLGSIVQIRVGKAIDILPVIADEGHAPFDLVFIDADKQSTPDYFTWALKLSRPGTVIIVDNVVRNGAVVDETSTDPGVVGIRRFFELAVSENHITTTALQTVGSKGYDGFAIAIVG